MNASCEGVAACDVPIVGRFIDGVGMLAVWSIFTATWGAEPPRDLLLLVLVSLSSILPIRHGQCHDTLKRKYKTLVVYLPILSIAPPTVEWSIQ